MLSGTHIGGVEGRLQGVLPGAGTHALRAAKDTQGQSFRESLEALGRSEPGTDGEATAASHQLLVPPVTKPLTAPKQPSASASAESIKSAAIPANSRNKTSEAPVAAKAPAPIPAKPGEKAVEGRSSSPATSRKTDRPSLAANAEVPVQRVPLESSATAPVALQPVLPAMQVGTTGDKRAEPRANELALSGNTKTPASRKSAAAAESAPLPGSSIADKTVAPAAGDAAEVVRPAQHLLAEPPANAPPHQTVTPHAVSVQATSAGLSSLQHGALTKLGTSRSTDLGMASPASASSSGSDLPTASFGDPRTLVATPNILEVGITGGAHGWLRVRAELGQTGEVTASLVASNAGSADALHKEVGAMSAFLKGEEIGISSLAVTTAERSSGASSASGFTMGAGAGREYGGGSEEHPRSRGTQVDSGALDGNADAGMPEWYGAAGAGGLGLTSSGNGSWLNVRA